MHGVRETHSPFIMDIQSNQEWLDGYSRFFLAHTQPDFYIHLVQVRFLCLYKIFKSFNIWRAFTYSREKSAVQHQEYTDQSAFAFFMTIHRPEKQHALSIKWNNHLSAALVIDFKCWLLLSLLFIDYTQVHSLPVPFIAQYRIYKRKKTRQNVTNEWRTTKPLLPANR